MASLTRWTWVWANSRSWWWTARPGMLQFMGSKRVGHDWATDLIWSDLIISKKRIQSKKWNELVPKIAGSPKVNRSCCETQPAGHTDQNDKHTFLLSRTCFGREQKYPCPKWTCARALNYPSPKSSILPPHQPSMHYHPYELTRVFLPNLIFSRKVDMQKEKKKRNE